MRPSKGEAARRPEPGASTATLRAALIEAFVLTVHARGFQTRCAVDIDDSNRVRIENIVDLIWECRYSIHYISRTELDRANNLPRFNMPLELGLFLGATSFGSPKPQRKRSLILDREPYRYQKFVSDIAGQDIKSHDGDPESAIRQVRNWLANSPVMADLLIPGPKKMVERYGLFREELPELCHRSQLDPDDLIFNDYTTCVSEWLKENDW